MQSFGSHCDVIPRVKPRAFSRPMAYRSLLVNGKKVSCFGVLSFTKMANSDSKSSSYDEAIEFQLKDDQSDRMLSQPGILAYHGEPLADHLETPNEENVDVKDPDGLLP